MYNQSMSPASKRPYRKRKRAQAEEETRLRITEAAVELHGSVGPAKTTVTEVAERAGVSRMTVYNHFPTDADLFQACSTHWATQNPFPDPTKWLEIEDPSTRLSRAVSELYSWYADKQGMLRPVLRDAPLVPALGELMGPFWGAYMERVVAALAEGWGPEVEPGSDLRAKIRVAVDFNTWEILSGLDLEDGEAADLAAEMASGAVAALT